MITDRNLAEEHARRFGLQPQHADEHAARFRERVARALFAASEPTSAHEALWNIRMANDIFTRWSLAQNYGDDEIRHIAEMVQAGFDHANRRSRQLMRRRRQFRTVAVVGALMYVIGLVLTLLRLLLHREIVGATAPWLVSLGVLTFCAGWLLEHWQASACRQHLRRIDNLELDLAWNATQELTALRGSRDRPPAAERRGLSTGVSQHGQAADE